MRLVDVGPVCLVLLLGLRRPGQGAEPDTPSLHVSKVGSKVGEEDDEWSSFAFGI